MKTGEERHLQRSRSAFPGHWMHPDAKECQTLWPLTFQKKLSLFTLRSVTCIFTHSVPTWSRARSVLGVDLRVFLGQKLALVLRSVTTVLPRFEMLKIFYVTCQVEQNSNDPTQVVAHFLLYLRLFMLYKRTGLNHSQLQEKMETLKDKRYRVLVWPQHSWLIVQPNKQVQERFSAFSAENCLKFFIKCVQHDPQALCHHLLHAEPNRHV